MSQVKIPAVFMRGGTSKAIIFHARDLPADRTRWDAIFLDAIGAPDPNGRQLDGMGGGVSSLSKVCIISPASRPDADVDYTFAQIGVTTPTVDYSGNCGNMSSAIGPFAVDEGLVPRPVDGVACVRIHNTNTGKIIHARFPVSGGRTDVEGEIALDGVAGTGAAIRLEFTDPGGAKTGRLLPTGRAVDVLDVPGAGTIEASLVDAANPCVFVAAEALGLTGTEMPEAIDGMNEVAAKLEAIRQAASVAMGMTANVADAARMPSVPKIAMLAAPRSAATLSGRELAAGDMDILARMISVGQAHRAIPLTGALCLAVATRVPGTIAHRLARRPVDGAPIRIGHASGTTVVDALVEAGADGTIAAHHAAVYRTARRLFEGQVLVRPRAAAGG